MEHIKAVHPPFDFIIGTDIVGFSFLYIHVRSGVPRFKTAPLSFAFMKTFSTFHATEEESYYSCAKEREGAFRYPDTAKVNDSCISSALLI